MTVIAMAFAGFTAIARYCSRLVRRTICFSKTERMHDLVIGLFVNRYELGRAI
jgi:hypothetical protein